MLRLTIAALAAVLLAGSALADGAPVRPDPTLTPGVARPGVTAADLCPVAHTPALRNVSAAEKLQVYAEYGMPTGPHTGFCVGPEGCEIDHLVSLELAGANDVKNLWPQSYAGPLSAHVKDKLENKLHALVCAGTIPLDQAQHEISTDWVAAAVKYGVIANAPPS